MLTNGKRVFANKMILYEMLNLRRIGISSYSLALFYGCDRKAIEKQCLKYGVDSEAPHVFNIERMAVEILKNYPEEKKESREFIVKNGERVCLGKNYADYKKPRSIWR